MSIEIKIPKEIKEYKERFVFGLTVRQCASAAAALCVCVPLYIFGKDALGGDVTGWLVMLAAAPILAFGFFRYNGLKFEDFLRLLYRQKWAEPQKRKYIDLPVFWFSREEIINTEIARQQLAAKKRKQKGNKDEQRKGSRQAAASQGAEAQEG